MRKISSHELQIILESSAEYYNSRYSFDERGCRADLTNTDLSNAKLSRVKLYKALLTGADLNRADLSDANLSVANLSGANLRGVDLSGADLSDANLNLLKSKLELKTVVRRSSRVNSLSVCKLSSTAEVLDKQNLKAASTICSLVSAY